MADLDLSLHSGTFTGDINVFLNNNVANKNDSWEGQSAHGVNNLIVGSGTFTLTQDLGNSNDLGDITIATGATLNADNDTIRTAGDFTTSGGLLGASCYNCDSSSDYFANTGSINFRSDSARDYTVEFWMKPDDVSGTKRLFHQYPHIAIRQNGATIDFFPNYNTLGATGSVLTAGKWTHVACTWDTSENLASIYIDGKLEKTFTDTTADTTGAAAIYLGRKHDGNQEYDGYLDEVRLWTDIRTESEIRADMFQGGTLANSGNLFARWSLDEGTGTTSDNSEGTSGNDLTVVAGGWAGAGTFTYGTSTLVMAKSGTQTFSFAGGMDVNNLTVNDGSTTTLKCPADSGGRLDIYGNLTVNEVLNNTENEQIRMYTGGQTIAVASDVRTTALASLYKINMEHTSGTTNIPELTAARISCNGNGGTTTATGDLTVSTKLEADGGTTFNANGNTINVVEVEVKNGGTFNLSNSTLNFYSGTGDAWTMGETSTLTTGNTTVTGANAGTPAGTPIYMPTSNASSSNFEIVGDVSLLVSYGETDLTVIGSVTNCTKNSDASIIRQWHHTLDTQQLLDADSAGDDDLRLSKPALDNAHELQTG